MRATILDDFGKGVASRPSLLTRVLFPIAYEYKFKVRCPLKESLYLRKSNIYIVPPLYRVTPNKNATWV